MEYFNESLIIILPAFIAGLIVLSTHIPLGQMVLKRGIIFIDLAVAQIAGLGVIFAHQIIDEPTWWLSQLIALASAIIGAVMLRWSEKNWADIQEALIGIVFILAATSSILLLSSNPQAGDHLQEILTGQILWVSSEQLIYTALVYAVVLLLWFSKPGLRSGLSFYIIFAICITLSVQLVGVYLVFSSLIIPAVAISQIKRTNTLTIAYSFSALAYLCGIILSLYTDYPTGPLIVLTLAASGILVWNIYKIKKH